MSNDSGKAALKRKAWATGLGLLLLVTSAATWLVWQNQQYPSPTPAQDAAQTPTEAQASAQRDSAEQIAQGAYLAKAGNCAGCHSKAGGAAYAGGRGVATPFGTVYAGNLTPDPETGLGTWTADHFWRALHNGKSKDGRLLAPAFPYSQYTLVKRADADALFAYLRSLPAVQQPTPESGLRFPYNTQVAIALWRALYFKPGEMQEDSEQSPAWNRGAYLVLGLGHCQACHAPRNRWGGTAAGAAMSGGLMPMQDWYAPSLLSTQEASVADWSPGEVVQLLQSGSTAKASVLGPMAGVVFGSTQHLQLDDLRAMATYLQNLPKQPAHTGKTEQSSAAPNTQALGAKVYEQHCANCHGPQGQGAAGAYLPLAGNRTVTMHTPVNLIRIVIEGGFAPATAGHPQPFGMPPFGPELSNAEIAAVVTHLRSQWGNNASAVTELQVLQLR